MSRRPGGSRCHRAGREDVLRCEHESAHASKLYYASLDQLKIQERKIADVQSKIVEAETKLKQQQNLYEQVRADHNLYSKSLIEHQDEIQEMKRRFREMNHTIESLKQEITGKDHGLVKEHFEHQKVEKERDILKNDINKVKKRIANCDQISANQAEARKLTQIIMEAEAEGAATKGARGGKVERTLLANQLTQRNNELHKLYDRIRLLRARLGAGESAYNDTCDEEEALRVSIQQLKDD